MKFHFEFDISKPPRAISHVHRMLLIGSCFTENIGEKLRRHKFTVMENPNGILFNPVSVCEAINQYIDNKIFSEAELFSYNEAWHSWKHHSRFSAITQEECLRKINEATAAAHTYLKHADHLMITLGSAWTYTLTGEAQNAQEGAVAANNHKGPASWFERKLLTADAVASMLQDTLTRLRQFNPAIQVIFTISPVRHLREGVIDNNRSKAVLIQAVHNIVAQCEDAYYFPAYELVIDDLRDYRFYAEDLVHPNYQATQYVWEKFVGACMSDATQQLMRSIAEINIAFQHKPFHPTSTNHAKFLASFYEKTSRLQELHPYLNFSEELQYFAKR